MFRDEIESVTKILAFAGAAAFFDFKLLTGFWTEKAAF
jgi:hypothetical protein